MAALEARVVNICSEEPVKGAEPMGSINMMGFLLNAQWPIGVPTNVPLSAQRDGSSQDLSLVCVVRFEHSLVFPGAWEGDDYPKHIWSI